MRYDVWDKKKTANASVPNYGKLYIVKPEIIKNIGNLNGKKVLELGCGTGFWLKLLQKKGAICSGVDISKNQLDQAIKTSKNIDYYYKDISKMNFLKRNSYDIVLLEHVLLEIKSLKKIKYILKEAYKIMKKGGILILCDLHPAAAHFEFTNVKSGKNYSYYKSGSKIRVISKNIEGKAITYNDHHWTFSDLINSLIDEKFSIRKISELEPSLSVLKKHPYLNYRKNAPLDIIIKAIKMSKTAD